MIPLAAHHATTQNINLYHSARRRRQARRRRSVHRGSTADDLSAAGLLDLTDHERRAPDGIDACRSASRRRRPPRTRPRTASRCRAATADEQPARGLRVVEAGREIGVDPRPRRRRRRRRSARALVRPPPGTLPRTRSSAPVSSGTAAASIASVHAAGRRHLGRVADQAEPGDVGAGVHRAVRQRAQRLAAARFSVGIDAHRGVDRGRRARART